MPSFELPPLLRSSAYPAGSRERRELDRRTADRDVTRIWPGVFVSTGAWSRLGPTQRYLLTVRAARPRISGDLAVSHLTALAHHRISSLHPWPFELHFTHPGSGRGRRKGRIVWHAGPLGPDETVEIDGLRVTSVRRTLADIAMTESFEVSVAAIDAALRSELVDAVQLDSALSQVSGRRGVAAAARAFEFANANSGSAGESWCRCRLAELGVTALIQQQRFEDAFGLIGFVDFWLPECGVVIEFDGDKKHLNPAYRNGRTIERTILDERKRERRLLAVPEVRAVVRVEWRDLVDPWRLRAKLVTAGVPC